MPAARARRAPAAQRAAASSRALPTGDTRLKRTPRTPAACIASSGVAFIAGSTTTPRCRRRRLRQACSSSVLSVP
jgi:hypothetical protein